MFQDSIRPALQISLSERRRCQGAINRPRLQTIVHSRFSNPELTRPLRWGLCDPVEGNRSCRASIVVLLNICRPSAIFWGISMIVVDAINRLAIWRHSHIGKECLRIMPTYTNINAASTIPVESLPIGLIAAGHHAAPNLVPRLFAQPMFSGFDAQLLSGGFFTQASARFGKAKSKMLRDWSGLISAVAHAPPSGFAVLNKSVNRNKAPKALPCKIFEVVRSHITSFRF